MPAATDAVISANIQGDGSILVSDSIVLDAAHWLYYRPRQAAV